MKAGKGLSTELRYCDANQGQQDSARALKRRDATRTTKTPIRVVVVIPRYHPAFGGAENQCRILSRRLVSSGVRTPWLLTKRLEERDAREETLDGIRVHRLGVPGVGRWSWYWCYALMFFWLLRRRSAFDLVHVHACGALGMAMTLAGTIARRPVILKLSTNGDLKQGIEGTQASIRRHFRWLAVRWMVRHAHLVALNREGLEELKWAGARHPHLIPNGVDSSIFHPPSESKRLKLRADHGFDSADFVFLYTGRFVARKGIDVLVDAFRKLLSDPGSATRRPHLCLVGSGRLQLEASDAGIVQFARDFPGAVHLLQPGGSVADYLRMSDAFAFPSRLEGMPNSVVEAIATGIPCVLSDIAPHRELAEVHPSARLTFFPSGDATALAEAMRRLLSRANEIDASALAPIHEIGAVARAYMELYSKAMHAAEPTA
jgi:L-malate glycosyltransferase